jgi:hypothetical protein
MSSRSAATTSSSTSNASFERDITASSTEVNASLAAGPGIVRVGAEQLDKFDGYELLTPEDPA